MSKVPSNLKYTKTHEWAEVLADGSVRVGITDHAQSLLGDMVYVELPESGRALAAHQECGVVESVKAASDIYSPVAGQIVEVNAALADAPELINKDPYGEGWLMRIKPTNPAELDLLLAADAYSAVAQEQTH
jgi:glycine cleavage system H protein